MTRRLLPVVFLLALTAASSPDYHPHPVAIIPPEVVLAPVVRDSSSPLSRFLSRVPLNTPQTAQQPDPATIPPHGLPKGSTGLSDVLPVPPVPVRASGSLAGIAQPASAGQVATTAPGERRGSADPASWAPWLRIAACESSGHWDDNTGNGYYGGLQEDMNFWHSYGDQRYARPDLAPEAAQIAAATKARDGGRGYAPWPVCGHKA